MRNVRAWPYDYIMEIERLCVCVCVFPFALNFRLLNSFPITLRRTYPSSLLLIYFFFYLFISFSCVSNALVGERREEKIDERKEGRNKNGEKMFVCTTHCPAVCVGEIGFPDSANRRGGNCRDDRNDGCLGHARGSCFSVPGPLFLKKQNICYLLVVSRTQNELFFFSLSLVWVLFCPDLAISLFFFPVAADIWSFYQSIWTRFICKKAKKDFFFSIHFFTLLTH